MANIYRGEVTVNVAGKAYTLRPTFHILCQLQERIGLDLLQLLGRIAKKGLLASEILMIVAIATRHDGSRPFYSETMMDMPADRVDLQALMPDIARFLLLSFGGKAGQKSNLSANAECVDVCAPDYALLLETAYTVLRLEPAAFWQLTMPEFRILLRAARLRHPQTAIPDATEIGALMQRFPDEPKHNEA
jgi:hypothetical protein